MSRYITVVSVVLLSLTGVSIADPPEVDYPNFFSVDGLNFVGSATQAEARLRLNQDTDTLGSVWFQTIQPVAAGFRTSFPFQYGDISGIPDANGNLGVDGIAFNLQPTGNTGLGSLRVNPGLSVWFDAWDNPDFDDIASSRVEVSLNGNILSQTDVEIMGIQFRNELVHHAEIEFDGCGLSVYLDSTFVAFHGGVDLEPMHNSYVGFMGYTGASSANQDVLNWSFEVVPVRIADANCDGKVDSIDLAIWQVNYDPLGENANTFKMADWNRDGVIDSADLALWQQYYDPIGPGGLAAAHVPEPATLFVMMAAGLPLLLRRKRPVH